MNILMFSIERRLFKKDEFVRRCFSDYASLIDSLDIIVLNVRGSDYKKFKISEGCWVYPTNSKTKWHYFNDALKIAREIKKDSLFSDGQEKKIDLITSQDAYDVGLVAYFVAKRLEVKALELQIHTDLFIKYFIKASLRNFLRSKTASFLLRKASHIRVVSKRIKNSLPRDISKDKISVVPIFTSSSLIQAIQPNFDLHQRYPQFKFIVLMMCRLESEKNIALAILAMQEVVKVFPKTGLLVVGSGSQRKFLRRLARRRGLEENVIFKKWTDDPISYFKTADLFLSTSNYEGYGLSLVEAIVSRCPILTTKVGIVGEVLSGNNALICDVGDKDCLVNSLKKAQQYPELLEEFKEKAYTDFLNKIPQNRNENLALIRKGWEKAINK